MPPQKFLLLTLVAVSLTFSTLTRAEAQEKPAQAAAATDTDPVPDVDFENADSFIDRTDALRSKQYVRRAILSSVIRTTSRFAFERPYLNHLMGFSAVFQRKSFSKFVSGVQGLSLGYITEHGHGFEAGLELSAVSNVFGGYRYIFRPENFSLWPFLGGGAGMEVSSIHFADGPPEAQDYDGKKQMLFGTFGFLVPLVDVGIKAELRFNFYGLDRLVLSSGVGVVVFL